MLTGLQEKYPDLEIEKVDVILQPGRAWKEGIRMIPALVCGEKKLAGIVLTPDMVRRFVEDQAAA